MKWLDKLMGKIQLNNQETEQTESEDVEGLEAKIQAAEEKIKSDKALLRELARAAASARRVHYQVDQFTEEIQRSFGRLHHG